MGSTGYHHRKLFTGLDLAHPVELFITLVEREAEVMEHDQAWILDEALRRIDRGTTPAGIWATSGNKNWESWEDLKSDLKEGFGSLHGAEQSPANYTTEERLEFLQSLVKPEYELFTTFLFRVQWVLVNVVGQEVTGDNDRWAELMFLMGLKDVDQKFMVGVMKEQAGADVIQVKKNQRLKSCSDL